MANIKQAYDWYQEGKRVRQKEWEKEFYISKNEKNCWIYKPCYCDILDDGEGWELYKEPMSEETKEALREVVRQYEDVCDTSYKYKLKVIIRNMGVDL